MIFRETRKFVGKFRRKLRVSKVGITIGFIAFTLVAANAKILYLFDIAGNHDRISFEYLSSEYRSCFERTIGSFHSNRGGPGRLKCCATLLIEIFTSRFNFEQINGVFRFIKL